VRSAASEHVNTLTVSLNPLVDTKYPIEVIPGIDGWITFRYQNFD
jgi:hypothetical protein